MSNGSRPFLLFLCQRPVNHANDLILYYLADFRAEHHDVNFSPSVSLCAIPGRKSGERRFDWTKHENFTGDFLDLARDVMFTEVAEILVLLELDQNTLHKKNVLNSIKFQRFMADDQAALMCHYFIPGKPRFMKYGS